uniref:Protein kinase domain-containing protein n=1 Tax=Phytophthora ramorum TaxID=164328 RepID=H3H2F7_PHYRM
MEFHHGRRLASYEDAPLPTNNTLFAFDGTNSDLARQLYLRAQAGADAPQITNLAVPDLLQKRLDELHLAWDKLPGIAQRALLWDSGFGVTLDNKAVQIWTLAGHSMTDLAVPLAQFQAVGCVEMNCTQPDNTTRLSNRNCNGAQMLNAVRCVMEDFEDPENIHASMWVTGGDPKAVPVPRVRKHEWIDGSSGSVINYTVLAVHTVDIDNEPGWGECPTDAQNGGYGSLVLSCHSTAETSDEVMNEKQEVEGSPWVSRWLVDEYSSVASTGSGKFDLVLIAPIVAGVCVIVGVIGLVIFFKRRRSNRADNVLIESPQERPSSMYGAYKDTAADGAKNGPCRSTEGTIEDAETAPYRRCDDGVKRSSLYEDDFSSGSNETLKILLRSEFLVGKRIPYEMLTYERALSKGASGEVWVGEYEGKQVAMKRLLQTKNNRAEQVEEFAKEIELSASLIHPNIVAFLGVAWNSLNNLVMVLEFFPVGDLHEYLSKNSDLLSWTKDKMEIAVGVMRAVGYLHSRTPPLIHRDLKSKNILLTRRLEPKLIDFGVSRDRQEHSMTAGVGTPYWTAPEILEGKRYTEQSDIYSFGVVLTELDTGKIPYHDALTPDGKKPKPFHILADVMAGVLRPNFSDDCPRAVRRIGVACCQQDPERRPTAAQILQMLKESE